MRKRGESGFALLLVFLMAAVIALTLYMQIPRVAFQTQRHKEQLLIERGEQYKRAIEVFYRTNHRYPSEIKELENFNNRRFLRHKFVDPMTGKDEWRLIHVNNGVLTDSLLNKKKAGDANQQQASTAGSYVGVQAGIGSTPATAEQNVNVALARRRASEGGAATPAVGPDGQPIPPGQAIPGTPPIPGQPIPGQPYPGQPVTGVAPVPGQAGEQPFTPGRYPFPGAVGVAGQIPGQPFPGGQPMPGQVQAQPFPAGQPFPGVQPQPFPGRQPNPGMPATGQVPFQPGGINPSGQLIGGRVPTTTPSAAQTNSSQSSYVGSSQPYVGGSSYVGSSQPYVGGGAFVGSQSGQAAPPPVPPTNTPATVNAPAPPFGAPANPVPGFGNPPPANPQTPNPGIATPGVPAGPLPSAAAGMLQNALLGQRPPAAGGPQPIGQQIGGGIAGVASKSEDAAIMVYNDRTNYNEWEFIFDYSKQKALPNPSGGVVGTPVANIGSVPGSQPGGIGLNPGGAGLNPLGAGMSPLGGSNMSPLGAPINPTGPGGTLPGAAGITTGTTSGAAPAAGVPGQAGGKQSLPTELRRGRP